MICINGTWVGRITFSVMFKGSRSEKEYPALYSDNGEMYRINVTDLPDEESIRLLLPHAGHPTRISGKLDNIRGHLRLSCTKSGIDFLSFEEKTKDEGAKND
jgi:hypothetical protein